MEVTWESGGEQAEALFDIADGSIDVVFTSNFLEHLTDKTICNDVFA